MTIFFYRPAVAAAILLTASLAHAQIGISVEVAPPALPVYAQPEIPNDGYLWTPGYWSWNANDNDYFWIPGTWVAAPYPGALWTPGYWSYDGYRYRWHVGYWGDHIGYYGGINYGFGYTGVGYQGGYWDHGSFSYNRSVNNVRNAHISHIYSSKVVVNENSHASYNGGRGGVTMTASKNEQIINSMPHNHPTEQQSQHENDARGKQDMRWSVNHGAPKVAATPEPGSFNSPKAQPAWIEPARNNRALENRPNNAQPAPEQRPQQRPQAQQNHQNARPEHEEERR